MTDRSAPPGSESITYASSGVDIQAAEDALAGIGDLVATTRRPGVLGGLGGFGGLFELPQGYERPVLVACTDGVGTKMSVAAETSRFTTVGIDLVAMCVDDLVCCGAEPLFFLDYQLTGHVDPSQVRALMSGIAEGCNQAGAAIIGGEIAEHPGLLTPGEVDMSGFAVGVVEKSSIIDGRSLVSAGDVLIGLASGGLRSNGYSLAREALRAAGRTLDDQAWSGAEHSLADELLRPSVIYCPAALELIRRVDVHAIAHITGGGIPGNLARVLSADVDAEIDAGSWPRPRIFSEVQQAGAVSDDEMSKVFNLGLGMIVVVAGDQTGEALSQLAEAGLGAYEVGRLVAGAGRVRLPLRG